MTQNGNKVYVGMSGGVDSSVCAALLKEQGYNVTGVFMKNWSGDDFGLQADCPWEIDQRDAQMVCKQLNIPFKSYNFEKEYREKVVEYFFEEYEKGRTPNPDVMCNKEVKFKLFLDKALEEGADYIATGHYVRKLKSENLEFENLLKGIDDNKDQSYFLCNLTQDQLNRSLFPVGDFEKPAIREVAAKLNLQTAQKPDSQGICFIGEINVKDFLKQRLGIQIGNIVDIDTNKVLGQHHGSYFYTIGQREGLGIGGAKEPYFVVKTDIKTNTVYVAMGTNNPQLYNKEVLLENIHFINPEYDITNLQLSASTRYRHKPQKGSLTYTATGEIKFIFDEPQRAVTPGQSLVLYDNDICIGGGTIK